MIPIITDFDEWLDANEPETEQDRDDLLESVDSIEDVGAYCTTRNGGRVFVKGWSDDALLLATERARQAFIARIKEIGVPDDLEEGFWRNMHNPKA